jgi:hypothetical protein
MVVWKRDPWKMSKIIDGSIKSFEPDQWSKVKEVGPISSMLLYRQDG